MSRQQHQAEYVNGMVEPSHVNWNSAACLHAALTLAVGLEMWQGTQSSHRPARFARGSRSADQGAACSASQSPRRTPLRADARPTTNVPSTDAAQTTDLRYSPR